MSGISGVGWPARRRRPQSFDRPRFLWVVSLFTLVVLFAPVVVVLLYSFNGQKSLVIMSGLSTQWYHEAVTDSDITSALWTSAEIALITTAVSAVIGTMFAFGLQRGSRWHAAVNNGALVTRLVAPETATAISLLLLFSQLHIALNRTAMIFGHIALCLPFVAVVIRSRVAVLNPEVEEAAMDLGATRLQSLRLVALPALWPAVAGASMLAFVLSFDDFVTSYFMSGVGVTTLPVEIYSMMRFGVTPAINAIGVMMMIITLAAVAVSIPLMRLGRRRTSTQKAIKAA
jgi:ABC-type spermidine/putrescine transport system permease subunit II